MNRIAELTHTTSRTHGILALAFYGLTAMAGCSPAADPEPIPDMMSMPSEDASPDDSPPDLTGDLPADLEDMAPDLPPAGCTNTAGERAAAGEELCEGGIAHECQDDLTLLSLEKTCQPVPVDIQISNLRAKMSSSGIYTLESYYKVTNLGTQTATMIGCQYQEEEQGKFTAWENDLASQQGVSIEPGMSIELGPHLPKYNTQPSTRRAVLHIRCTAANEDELAATLGNARSVIYTY